MTLLRFRLKDTSSCATKALSTLGLTPSGTAAFPESLRLFWHLVTKSELHHCEGGEALFSLGGKLENCICRVVEPWQKDGEQLGEGEEWGPVILFHECFTVSHFKTAPHWFPGFFRPSHHCSGGHKLSLNQRHIALLEVDQIVIWPAQRGKGRRVVCILHISIHQILSCWVAHTLCVIGQCFSHD